jgi:ribosomal protein L37AE/L43A
MADSYVGKPCPKCAHARAGAEGAPDWQCPKCGVAYAKFLQIQTAAAPGSAFRASAASSTPTGGSSGGMAKFAHLSTMTWHMLE